MKENSQPFVFDGTLVSGDTPVASADSRGLMYGDGVFDTIRTYDGKCFLFSRHYSRTIDGLEYLGITIPKNFTAKKNLSNIKDLLNQRGLLNKNAIIRMQVWRDGNRGYLPERGADSHFIITASECPREFKSPSLATVEACRIPSLALDSRYKLTNGLNYIQASRQADDKGADDALMQTVDGLVAETTKANLFWRQGNEVFTPSEDCDILPGITRSIVMNLVRNHNNLKLTVGHFPVESVLDAEAVWMCNSVRELLPVHSVDGYHFETHDNVFNDLKKSFISFRNNQLKPL